MSAARRRWTAAWTTGRPDRTLLQRPGFESSFQSSSSVWQLSCISFETHFFNFWFFVVRLFLVQKSPTRFFPTFAPKEGINSFFVLMYLFVKTRFKKVLQVQNSPWRDVIIVTSLTFCVHFCSVSFWPFVNKTKFQKCVKNLKNLCKYFCSPDRNVFKIVKWKL